MSFDFNVMLFVVTSISVLMVILQQQKIKNMNNAIYQLEEEWSDKIMIIKALTSHVDKSDTNEETPNSTELPEISVDNDAEPIIDNLTVGKVIEFSQNTGIIPNTFDKFYLAWYCPSQDAFENYSDTLSESTVKPWLKRFVFERVSDTSYSATVDSQHC